MGRTLGVRANAGEETNVVFVEDGYPALRANPLEGIDAGGGAAPTFGDLDGDGLTDLVAVGADGSLIWHRNAGTARSPSFSARRGDADPFSAIDAGAGASPALGDVDGDGDLDLVVGNADGSLTWHRNAGTARSPSFVAHGGSVDPFSGIDAGIGASPVLADLDGDGDLDLVVGGAGGSLTWYRNVGPAGSPSFVARRGVSDPFSGIDAAPALWDVDGDGDLDLVVGTGDGGVDYHENVGTVRSPLFAARTGRANPFSGVETDSGASPVLADLDGNGVPDLVVVDGSGEVLRFAPPVKKILTWTRGEDGRATGFVEDLDGDGSADRRAVYAFDGSGRVSGFSEDTDGDGSADRTVSYAFDARGRRIGDAVDDDGDGRADRFASWRFDGDDRWIGYVAHFGGYASDGSDLLSGISAEADAAPAFGDVDGDWDLDLVVGGADGSVSWHENVGTLTAPSFAERTGSANPFDGVDVGAEAAPAFGDVDGDGDLDLAVGGADGSVSWHENVGTSTAPSFVERTGSADPFDGVDAGAGASPVLADLDGDGDLDLVVGGADGSLVWYLNKGLATEPVFVLRVGSADPFDGIDAGSDAVPFLADVDGDGDLDLVTGKGDGTFSHHENAGTDRAPSFVARNGLLDPFDGLDAGDGASPVLADLDGDGVPDLVAGASGGGLVRFARPPRKIVTWTFDERGRQTGHTVSEDRDGNGIRERIETHTFTADGRRIGRTDAVDADEDGVAERTVRHVFAQDGRRIGFVATGDVDGDGIRERAATVRLFDADGESNGRVAIDLKDADGDGTVDRAVTRFFDADGRKTGQTARFFRDGDPARTGLLDGLDAGERAMPAVADVNGDGLPDLVVGTADGGISYFENVGAISAPSFAERTGSADPFDGLDAGSRSAPFLADLDGDGDLDLTVGNGDGGLSYHENAGTARSPSFAERTGSADPFDGLDVGTDAVPFLADLDGDGDLDLVAVGASGVFNHYRNAGTATAPSFVADADDPLSGVVPTGTSAFFLADEDGDGDLDLWTVDRTGSPVGYENAGTATSPSFVARARNDDPFSGVDASSSVAVVAADLDGDGVLDLVVGDADGGLEHLTRPVSKTVTWTLDEDGEETGYAKDDDGDGSADRTVTATFDDFGRRNGRIRTDSEDRDGDGSADRTVTYVFDRNGRMTGYEVGFGYEANRVNPFGDVDAGSDSAPALADLDGDGDFDLVVGGRAGVLNYWENTGTGTEPAFVERRGSANPFDGIDVGNYSTPTFADVSGDGLLDLVVGEGDGVLNYWENTGSTAEPAFVERRGSANPFDGIDVGSRSAPALADLDGSGDSLHLVVGEREGTLVHYYNYRNESSTFAPYAEAFQPPYITDDPFEGVDVGSHGAPAWEDVSGDDTPDLVVGKADGSLNHYEMRYETGSPFNRPVSDARVGGLNPFDGVDAGTRAKPVLADLNGDGDLDLVVGRWDGGVGYFTRAPEKIVTWTFDETGRRTGHTVDLGGDGSLDRTVTWTFDETGRRIGETTDFGYGAGSPNPFAGIDTNTRNAPSLVDLDGDGDLDLVIGKESGLLFHYENTGTATAPMFERRPGSANPFDGIDGTWHSHTLGDVDGDGDLDLLAGEGNGSLTWYENAGTAAEPAFAARVGDDSPFDGINVGSRSAPAFVDLDGDGDLDLVVGENGGKLFHYENTGTATDPAFVARTENDNPFAGIDVGYLSAPAFADLDGDEDIDLLVAENQGTLYYYENTGTATAPAFTARSGNANPFAGIDAPFFNAPFLADLNDDGVPDLALGEAYGSIRYFTRPHQPRRVETYAFDEDGRRIGYAEDVDGDGTADKTVTFAFDGEGRRVGRTEDLNGDGTADRTETWTLDADGRRVGRKRVDLEDVDGDGRAERTVTSTFDGNDRPTGLVEAEDANGDGTADRIVTWTFDGTGRRTGHADDTDGDGTADRTVTWTFDGTGRRTGHAEDTDGDGTADRTVTWTFDETGRRRIGFAEDADGDGTAERSVTDVFEDGVKTGYAEVLVSAEPDGGMRTETRTYDTDDALTSRETVVVSTAGDGTRTETTSRDEDGDGIVDRIVVLTFDARDERSASSVSRFRDRDGDGIVDETRSWIFDGQGTRTEHVMAVAWKTETGEFRTWSRTWNEDNVLTRSVVSDDADGDGIADAVTTHVLDETGRMVGQRVDADENGETDFAVTYVFAGSGRKTGYAVDADGDLVPEKVVTWTFDAVGERSGYRSLPGYEAAILDPFDDLGVAAAGRGAPLLADMDGDGDLDLAMAGRGGMAYRKNVGSASAPSFARTAADGDNPFFHTVDGRREPIDMASPGDDAGHVAPVAADVDGDGDLDLVAGDRNGRLRHWENAGSPSAPVFVESAGIDNPFAGIDAGDQAAPALGDLDRDGDLDLAVGNADGAVAWYENVGDAGTPTFVERIGSDNPFSGIDANGRAAPVLADVDGDGLLDLVVGSADGPPAWHRNVGTAEEPAFVEQTGVANPFAGIDMAGRGAPVLGDVDGDGVLDLVTEKPGGGLGYFTARGETVSWTEDARGRRNGYTVDKDGDGTADVIVTRTLDADGRRLSETRDLDGDGTADSILTWTYDGVGRRTRLVVDEDADGTADRIETWTYDDPEVETFVGNPGTEGFADGGAGAFDYVAASDTDGDLPGGADGISGIESAENDDPTIDVGPSAEGVEIDDDAVTLAGNAAADLAAEDFLFG